MTVLCGNMESRHTILREGREKLKGSFLNRTNSFTDNYIVREAQGHARLKPCPLKVNMPKVYWGGHLKCTYLVLCINCGISFKQYNGCIYVANLGNKVEWRAPKPVSQVYITSTGYQR